MRTLLTDEELFALMIKHRYDGVLTTGRAVEAAVLSKDPSAVVEAPADEKHPDWYTWTWDVFVHGGRWRAEYGWEHPPIPDPSGHQIRRNLQPLFTKPQPKAGEVAALRSEAARLREALAEHFESAFNLVFEAYSMPADRFHDIYAFVAWQQSRITQAFTHLQKVRTMTNGYSCAKRAADPTNEFAACREWCGNEQTCVRAADESLVETMVRFYRQATPEMQAYLRGDGPMPAGAESATTGKEPGDVAV